MSVENVKKYGKLCMDNEEVRKKAKEIGLRDRAGHIAHAKSLGLEISEEDFEALVKEAGLDGKSELSDEDLKKVAGGSESSTVVLSISAAVGFPVGMAVVGGINQPKW
jgi:predicted ribosomally synthesized peptide with nif11-like leader